MQSTALSLPCSSPSTISATDSAVASSSLRASVSSGQPDAAAYGARLCTQRTLLEVTSRVGAYAASNGVSRCVVLARG